MLDDDFDNAPVDTTITDRLETSLFGGEPPPEEDIPAQAAEDAPAAEESPEDIGTEATPATDVPPGLTEEEAAAFKASPPEVQKAWARREQDRTKELRRQQNEHAERLKAFEAREAQLNQERQALTVQRNRYRTNLEAEFQQKFGNVTDPVKLATEDPVRFSEYQAYALKFQQVAVEDRMIQEKAAHEHQALRAKTIAEQEAILAEAMPEWGKDMDKGRREIADVRDYIAEQGVPRERVDAMFDARAILIARKAMLYDRAQAKIKSPPVADAPKVQRPGRDNGSARDEKHDALRQKLKRTGDGRFAAAMIEDML